MTKKDEISIISELEKIKKLLVLLLSQSSIPVPNVVKAAGMSPNEIYKFIPKKRGKKLKKN